MTALSNMRRRITLMREEKQQGAGGRLASVTPIIADVWAVVEESAGGVEERADQQIFGSSARFTVRYREQYRLARQIEWRGARYRISSTEADQSPVQSLTFIARLMEEDAI